MKRNQHCFWCGQPLGHFDSCGDLYLTCGARECEREARYQRAADTADAQQRAEDDDYGAYR